LESSRALLVARISPARLNTGTDFYCLVTTNARVWLATLRSNAVGTTSLPGSLPAIVSVFPSTL
jgi:hypothetical protein